MAQQGRRRLGRVALAALLAGASGCLSFCHPIDPPKPPERAPCEALPQACRNRVHIFFIQGLDPLDFDNLDGVAEYVQQLGFIKTYYGQLYHTWYFEDELRKVHKEDPEARFVLVGFSFGANMVRCICNSVKKDDIRIDLLVYLGGNTLENTPPNRPDNVLRVVNILATGWIWNGATLDNAENLNYSDCWHFGSPSHPQTLEVLRRELPVVASRVPIVFRAEPEPPPPGPTPRPLPPPREVLPQPLPEDEKAPQRLPPPRQVPDQTAARDEWDFLKPDGSAGGLPGRQPGALAGETLPATLKEK